MSKSSDAELPVEMQDAPLTERQRELLIAEREIQIIQAELQRRQQPASVPAESASAEILRLTELCQHQRTVEAQLQGEINKLEAAAYGREQAQQWVQVSERLPDIDTPVLAVSEHYADSIYPVMRVDGGEGWLWAVSMGDKE